MVDQLVMLLSTDWFRPYWETLGIQVDDISKSLIQLGCRKILEQILDGAENYYHISFARERIEETRSMLLSLTGKPGTGETLRKVVERWDNLSEEDEKAAWMWNALTSDVLAGRVRAVETGLNPS